MTARFLQKGLHKLGLALWCAFGGDRLREGCTFQGRIELRGERIAAANRQCNAGIDLGERIRVERVDAGGVLGRFDMRAWIDGVFTGERRDQRRFGAIEEP